MASRKTPARPLRAIVYVRVSSYDTTAEEAANQSPEVQRDRCLAHIQAANLELAEDIGDGGVIFDLDVSGSDKGNRLNRPGLLIARDAIKARRVDVIVALRLDRLARNTADLLLLAEELEANGGAFALAEGDINTAGPYGKLILTIIAAIAEMEARLITARTMAGKVAAREQGRWIGARRPPYGYIKAPHPTIKHGWTLAIDPARAPIVANVVQLILDGVTPYKISRWLNDQGVPSISGIVGGWRAFAVRDVFTHESMVGRHFWQGDVLRDAAGMARTVFPPLVTEDTWRQLIARLGSPKRNRADIAPPEQRPAPHTARGMKVAQNLLSGGIARCGNCGGPLSVGPDNQGNKRYRCDRRGKGNCHRGVSARVENLDAVVTDRFLRLAGDEYFFEEQITETRPDASRRADLTDALRVARANLADAVETEDDTAEAAARTQVRTLRTELDDLPRNITTDRRRVYTSEPYRDRWARLDTHGRRAMLAPLVTVTVDSAGTRTATGHYDTTRAALEARVTTAWLDELVESVQSSFDDYGEV